MKVEPTNEELKKGIRNPYFSISNRLVEVPISNEDFDVFEKIARENGGRPELVMRRCLADYAKQLTDFDGFQD